MRRSPPPKFEDVAESCQPLFLPVQFLSFGVSCSSILGSMYVHGKGWESISSAHDPSATLYQLAILLLASHIGNSHTLIGQEVADGQFGLVLFRSCRIAY